MQNANEPYFPVEGGSGGFVVIVPCPEPLISIDRILHQQQEDDDPNLQLLRDWDRRFNEKYPPNAKEEDSQRHNQED